MTIKEAMNIIHGAIDGLYNFYGNDADSELEEIFKAEAILDDYVEAKEAARPEKYWAVVLIVDTNLSMNTSSMKVVTRTEFTSSQTALASIAKRILTGVKPLN